MPQDEIFTTAMEILDLLGEAPLQVSFLAKGATCNVWRVRSINQKTYVLRIIEEDERVIDGATDHHIRCAVLALGARVATPILNSETTRMTLNGKRWGLDAFVKETHPKRGALPDIVCRQLGETLANVHQLPVQNFGPLTGVTQGIISGAVPDPFEGVKQRFENPLPETWHAEFNHPVLDALPQLANEIMARLRAVSQMVNERHSVLCHTDLHEGQLLCNETNLMALIDFGGASILDKHWDLGSIYYFHGKNNFETLYEAYLTASADNQSHPDLASSFSIAIAMHHASRARLPGKHHRLKRAVEHIQRVIVE